MSKQIAANRYAKKNPGRKVASWVPVPNRSNRNLTDYLIWKNFLMNTTKYIVTQNNELKYVKYF